MRDPNRFRLIVATFTPFDQSGRLNLAAIDNYANYLISKNISGVFVCGTSGEGLLLSVNERKQVLEQWMPFRDRLKIIAHVSTTNYMESVVLAEHAAAAGVDAIACMGPCYLPPKRAEELAAFNRIIASSAPGTPYYYYHMPAVSGVHMKMGGFLKIIGDSIPNFAGIKFTSPDVMDMQECILFGGKKYDILHGSDGILLSGLNAGVSGGIGTSFNVIPELFHSIVEAFGAGDLESARELQVKAAKFLAVLHKYEGSVVSTKAILNFMGLNLGPCRLPLRNLSSGELADLRSDLDALDFFNLAEVC